MPIQSICRTVSLLLLLLVTAILTSRTPTDAADATTQLVAKLYEGAKKEGKLVIYGLGEPFLTPIATTFKRR
jgi:hypothetical protein